MKKKLIDIIKGRGYWRINFRPLVFKTELITLQACKDVIQKNIVQQRGWNYPHFPFRNKEDAGLEANKNYYTGWIDWEHNKEFWHMYQSGQFLHYLSLIEDWVDEIGVEIDQARFFKMPKKLEILRTLYSLTEIYEFAKRLTRNGLYEEGIEIFITLNNTEDRILCMMDPGRTELYDEYRTKMSFIEFKRTYSKEEILSNPRDLALNALSYFFDRFSWHNLPLITFRNDQSKIYP